MCLKILDLIFSSHGPIWLMLYIKSDCNGGNYDSRSKVKVMADSFGIHVNHIYLPSNQSGSDYLKSKSVHAHVFMLIVSEKPVIRHLMQ